MIESVSEPLSQLRAQAEEKLDAVQQRYAPGEDRPLKEFAALMATYSGTVVALAGLAAARGKLTKQVGAGDIALYGVATFRLARILAKDPITSPLRAPFTKLEGTTGPAELHEEVQGHGMQHAIGELLTCPFCMGQWVATGFVFGGMLAPRFTRSVAATFVVHAISDALQFGYAALEKTDQ